MYVQTCSLDFGVDHEAIRGDDLSSPSLVIEDTDNEFSEYTSSVIVQVEGELLMFIGTEAGTLLKVWY